MDNSLANVLKTGYRLILILKILFEGEYTKTEILNRLNQRANFKISKETLKLDINSLIKAGFKIKRGDRSNNYKISLLDKNFPFNFLNKEDFHILNMVKIASLDLLEYSDIVFLQKFYSKISNYLDEEFKRIENFQFYNLINPKILEIIEQCILEKRHSIILYDSPSGRKVEYTVIPLEITEKGGKIYLECETKEYQRTTLRFDNIKNVEKGDLIKEIFLKSQKPYIYRVKNSFFESYTLDKKERIIEEDEKSCLIENMEQDRFFVIQRILTLGDFCIEIKDKSLKNDVLKSLRTVLERYKKCS